MRKHLDEKIFVEINGMRQGMFLQSENTNGPVLLFLHGGPGSPEICFTKKYPAVLEKLFTICWWEQRGSGISYSNTIPKELMTIEQMISDILAVAKYLKERFGKEKIYVMGHSCGSFLGMFAVQRAPEYFYAYIGIAQVCQQAKSEQLAYDYMLQKYHTVGNKKMVYKLEKFRIDNWKEINIKYHNIRNVCMNQLGIGLMHNSVSRLEIVMILLCFKGYTWKEKMQYLRGGSFSLTCLWSYVLCGDLFKEVPCIEVPVYMLHGKYDYKVSYSLAEEYIRVLQAPLKGFYTFEDSAHSPCQEEPEWMFQIMQEDVLQGRVDLADSLECIDQSGVKVTN
ncbi:alpha/beta hydrolase [Clostridioides difficile]|nr:alpha/beta hydrolase [Clostridioides difficile]